MTENTNGRNINHELSDTIALLDGEYETTTVDCEPGDSAIRITKQDSKRTLYIIAYSDPDYTETMLYDKDDLIIAECTIYNGALDNLTAENLANDIRKLF